MNQQPPGVDELWIQHQRRNARTTQSWACIHCPDRHIFVNSDELWEHALREHHDRIPSDEHEQRRYRTKFEVESAEKKRTTKDDWQPRKPNLNEAINAQPEPPPALGPHEKRPLSSPQPTRSLSGLGQLDINGTLNGSDIAIQDASEDSQTPDQPRKRNAIGDGISAGSASPFRDSSASPPPRRSKAQVARPTSAPGPFASETDARRLSHFDTQRPSPVGKMLLWSPDHDVPVSKTSFDPSNIASLQGPGDSTTRKSISSSDIASAFSSTCERVLRNGRKALRVVLKGIEHLACPDSGSDKNVISEDLAKRYMFRLRCGKNDKKRFELGSGAFVESLGRIRLPCAIAKSLGPGTKQWFYVLSNCAVPLIIGRQFLEMTQVLTNNRRFLERCPPELVSISSLKFIGSPRKRSGIGVSMSGRLLVATPDTGSDLNLISLACAERERFHIDKSHENQVRLQNADGSETTTVGRVYVPSVSLDLRRDQTVPTYEQNLDDKDNVIPETSDGGEAVELPGETFYVVKGLACDVILGDDFLDRSDAFNVGTKIHIDIPHSQKDLFSLKIFKLLGPVQSWFGRTRIKPSDSGPEDLASREHYLEMRTETKRRDRSTRRIEEMVGAQQDAARTLEQTAIDAFNERHLRCSHCLSRQSNR